MENTTIVLGETCICPVNHSAVTDPTNVTTLKGNPWDDATWVLTSAFVIFTMQSGFGLLESGTATAKNEVNIMVKNAVDVIFGGFSFYVIGYGLSFGDYLGDNGFIGLGKPFLVDSESHLSEGYNYTYFIFQLAFSTTTTTIVSGAMIERTRLEAYIIFSLVNTVQSSFPVRWVWAPSGFLRKLGVIDIAGGGVVHIVGGVTGLVATLVLRPRHRRYKMKTAPPMGSPTNVVLGMFMLWWGWLGFNCGSTQGVTGLKWTLAARSAIATINASIGGGITGIVLSYLTKRRKFELSYLVSSVLGSLVSVTAMCTMCSPRIAIIIGVIGGIICCAGIELLNFLHIDDPVGVVPVHLFCGIWSLIAAGLLTPEDDIGQGFDLYGLFMGGGPRLLCVQLLAIVCIMGWCAVFSVIVLLLLSSTIGLRVSYHEELLGADLVEHNIGDRVYDKTKGRLVSRPKWLQRLERQGLLKPREHSIREVENATESAPCNKSTLGSEQNSFHRRSRVPRFKVLSSSLFKNKLKLSKRQKPKVRPSPKNMSPCRLDTVRNGDPGEVFNNLEASNNALPIPQHRRGARRINGTPLKWQELLDTNCDLNDIQYANEASTWSSSYSSRYAITTRNVGTQTDWIYLTAETEWRVLNMHENDPERTVSNMRHEALKRGTQKIKIKKRILDPHDWNSLYEHMV